jgi:hypothetical protein
MATPTSIFSRKRDLAYLVFFLIHIPVLLCKNHLRNPQYPPPFHLPFHEKKNPPSFKTSKPKNQIDRIFSTGVDLGSLYPSNLKPAFITSIREFYITTYADRFFSHPPAWFNMYVWVELIYHLPLSFWAIGALIKGEFESSTHLDI